MDARKRAIDRQGFLERRDGAAVVASGQRRLTETGEHRGLTRRQFAGAREERLRLIRLPLIQYVRPSQIRVVTSSGTISSTRLNAMIDLAVSPLLL